MEVIALGWPIILDPFFSHDITELYNSIMQLVQDDEYHPNWMFAYRKYLERTLPPFERSGLQPIQPKGTVLAYRRFRPNQRAGVPWSRPRLRGSELKETA